MDNLATLQRMSVSGSGLTPFVEGQPWLQQRAPGLEPATKEERKTPAGIQMVGHASVGKMVICRHCAPLPKSTPLKRYLLSVCFCTMLQAWGPTWCLAAKGQSLCRHTPNSKLKQLIQALDFVSSLHPIMAPAEGLPRSAQEPSEQDGWKGQGKQATPRCSFSLCPATS